MRIILSSVPRSCAPHYCYHYFSPSRAGGHATGTPQRTSAAHAPPQNDSSVRACDSVGEIAHKPAARLSVRKNTSPRNTHTNSLAPGTSSIAACLGFSVLEGDVTRSHHRPTGRGLLKRKPLCAARTTLQFQFAYFAGT